MKTFYIFLILILVIFVLFFSSNVQAARSGHKRLKRELNEYKYKPYIDSGYKYVARDYDGTLNAYKVKPFKYFNVWICRPMNKNTTKEITINHDLFSSVQWYDEKPTSFDDLMNGEI